jgi:hypothetical protein
MVTKKEEFKCIMCILPSHGETSANAIGDLSQSSQLATDGIVGRLSSPSLPTIFITASAAMINKRDAMI